MAETLNEEDIYTPEFLSSVVELVKNETMPLPLVAMKLLYDPKRSDVIKDAYLNTELLYQLHILSGPGGGITSLSNKSRREVDYTKKEKEVENIELEETFVKSLNDCIKYWRKQIPRNGVSLSFFTDRLAKKTDDKNEISSMIRFAINNGFCGKMYCRRNIVMMGDPVQKETVYE